MKKMYFNWSTGKDAALALYHLQKENQFDVDHLLVSVNKSLNQVSMHGLNRELMIKQLEAIGLDYSTVELPAEPSNNEYSKLMSETVGSLKDRGYHDTGFGDIFLEDLREYREEQLQSLNIRCHFPLWKRNTRELLEEFIDLGFKAIVVCIDSNKLDKSFCGREIDKAFLEDLPKDVDPCGEYGEFHTFCYEGPIFKKGITFKRGAQIFKTYKHPNSNNENRKSEMGFWFQELTLQ